MAPARADDLDDPSEELFLALPETNRQFVHVQMIVGLKLKRRPRVRYIRVQWDLEVGGARSYGMLF